MPGDSRKTKAQLLNEIRALRERIEEIAGSAEPPPAISQLQEEIAEHERVSKELRDTGRFLQATLDALQDGLSVLDRDLNIVRTNWWMQKMYGHEVPLEGRKCHEVYQRRDDPCPWCPTTRAIETGEAQRVEVPYPDAEAPAGWMDLSAFPIKSEAGDVTGVIEYVKDITDRKRAEEALRESEERFRTLATNIPGVSYRCACDPKWTMEFISEGIETLTGYPASDFLGTRVRSYASIIHPDDRKSAEDLALKAVAQKRPYTIEYRVVCADGGTRHVFEKGQGVFDSHGQVVSLDGVILDITHLKQAEEELRRYEHMVSGSSDRIALLDTDFRYLAANEAYLKTFDTTRDQLIGHTAAEAFGEEAFREIVEPNAKRCLLGEEVHYREWLDFPSQGRRHMDVVYYPYKGAGNEVKGFAVFARDDTEHEQVEDALRDSEARHRAVLETMTDAVAIAGMDGRIQFVNEGFCDTYGYTRQEAVGMTALDLIRTDFHPVFEDFVKQIVEKGNFSGETIDLRKDGTEFNAEVRGAGIRMGGQDCLLAVIRDVTERKEAQHALEEQAHELALMHRRVEVRNAELQKALDEIATLRGIVPICSFCKKVRDDDGYWKQVDMYIGEHTEAEISHGLCPDCLEKHYPDYS